MQRRDPCQMEVNAVRKWDLPEQHSENLLLSVSPSLSSESLVPTSPLLDTEDLATEVALGLRGEALPRSTSYYATTDLYGRRLDAIILSKTPSWLTALAPRGGPSYFVKAKRVTGRDDLLSQQYMGPDNREIARVFLQCPGALEIILMLADVGSSPIEALVPDAVDERILIEAVAELRRCVLVSIKDKMIALTKQGVVAAAKLRKIPKP